MGGMLADGSAWSAAGFVTTSSEGVTSCETSDPVVAGAALPESNSVLQTLEVGLDLLGMHLAQIAILLESLLDDGGRALAACRDSAGLWGQAADSRWHRR